jgi:phosphate transport system substrate-binding protein
LKKFFSIAALVLVASLALTGCQPATPPANGGTTPPPQPQKATIIVNGSDTMVNMGAAIAEEFMKTTQNIEIVVSGGGSGTGIASLINGSADIAQSSRSMKQEEKDNAGKQGTLHEVIVAFDGLAAVVHPSNPVKEMTLQDLAKIYRGEITNWKDVGGNDATIVLLSRDTTSGTHVFFKEFVVQEDGKVKGAEFAQATMMMPSTQAIVDELTSNVNGIGYVGMGYLRPSITPLAMKANADAPAVMPSVAAVQDNTYGLARPLFFYIVGSIEGAMKEYMDFVVSEAGQKVVANLSFVPISK